VPGPLGVRLRPRPRYPGPVRALGTPWSPEQCRSHPSSGFKTPHPKTSLASLKQDDGGREGGGEIRPAGHRSDRAGACGHRAGVPRWGFAGVVSYEQRGAPPRGVHARSHAQAGRRAELDAQPARLIPARGAKQSHAVKREKGPPRHRQNNRLHAVTRTKPAAHPSGNNEASRSDERKADSESAGQQEGSRSEKREPGHTPAWQNESPLGRGKINPGRRASP